MTRVALCFNGLAGGKNDKGLPVDWQLAVDHFKENIINLQVHEVDVFFHTWSTEAELELVELYEPKKYMVQKQIDFDSLATKFNKRVHSDVPRHFHSIMSRWYSNEKVLRLKSDYEKEHGFKYDYVMTSRFDVAWLRPWTLASLTATAFGAGDMRKEQSLIRSMRRACLSRVFLSIGCLVVLR